MKILITGASGLIGSALDHHLQQHDHQVIRLVRDRAEEDEDSYLWTPAKRIIDTRALEGVDGVVHLAGAPIAARRWTPEVKQKILKSRIQGTRLLAETMAAMTAPPKVWVSASAIGYYGNRGDDILDEQSPGGSGFLAEVARQWEAATTPASAAGIRVVQMRFGVVLSKAGGALPRMLYPFKFCLGGTVGSRKAFISWITLHDAVSAIRVVLESDKITGPVNTVAPVPVTHREFAQTLGRVLHRPSLFPVPACIIRLLLGEMGAELLLASTRVVPTTLQDAGFIFQHREIEDALRHVLREYQ